MKTLFTALSILVAFSFSQAQTFTNYTDADGLISNSVNCLDVAANDVLWFGTQAGVSVFDGTDWTTHSTATDAGFVDDVVTAIRVLSNGDVWIGSDFGAAHYNGTSWTTYTETDGLGDDRIKTVYEDSNGDIWFGTNDGFTIFDGANWTSYGTSEGLPFGGVASIAENASGTYYIGTALGGITVSINFLLTEITENEGLLNDKVRAIVIDDAGNKWVGTSDGISVFDNSDQLVAQHTTMFTLPAPDTLNPVEDVVIDSQGNVWAGIYVDYLVTEGGITAYNGTDWTQYDVSNGLIGPVVRQLAVDGDDNIWVATSTGISKISGIDLNTGIPNTEEISRLNIYPNPATDILTVELPSKADMEQLEFYDASLRLVKSENINQSNSTVQVSVVDLPRGVYLLQMRQSVSRLIVE